MSQELAPASADPTLGPITVSERVNGWDLARGIAVLGILLANMPWMGLAGMLSKHGEYVGDRPYDDLAFMLVLFVADTKFVTQFSLLFGAGLAQMRERVIARGSAFTAIGARRMAALAVAGALHAVFLWFGDILLLYATIGFVLLALLPRSSKALLGLGASLLVLGAVSWLPLVLVDADAEPPTFVDAAGVTHTGDEALAAQRAHFAEVFASGDFWRMTKVRAEVVVDEFGNLVFLMGPRTLALFLLGAWLVRIGWLTRPREHRGALRRWFVFGVPFGLACTAAMIVLDEPESSWLRATQILLFYVGGLVQGFGYLAGALLWSTTERAVALRSRLEAVGRMAFTNYIAHSVLTAIVFNYGGLYDRHGRGFGLGLTLVIFSIQLAWSPWWLGRFRFGPLEWLWRQATYAERIPLRR
ncbi:MAG: DUF418 domain-containing protein [Planctomycetes bacterium]|nr:DUF418 domain-containing protein [Planctomycetota bacterium]MCC7169816.1 DUF418 domain-containing protein [Planctomycetota bacterium]